MNNTRNESTLLVSAKFLKQKAYWKKKLEGIVTPTSLSSSEQNAQSCIDRAEQELVLTQEIYEKLMKICKGSELSVYIALLSALKILVLRCTQREDISVLSPVYVPGRDEETLNQVVIIRDHVTASLTFKELLLIVRKSVLEAYEHQQYPLAQLMTLLYHEARPLAAISSVACSLTNIHGTSSLDGAEGSVFFRFELMPGELKGSISYPQALYRVDGMQQLAACFQQIIEALVNDVQRNILDGKQLSELEPLQLLQVSHTEDRRKAAPLSPLASMQLDETARRLARMLQEKGAAKTPSQDQQVLSKAAAAPRHTVEGKLVEIWEKVLGHDHIGIHDNFFTNGGDSIKTIQVAARLTKEGYHLNLKDIFENPTIASLAPYITMVEHIADQAPVVGYVPLTPIQRHFFSLVKVDPQHHNQSILLKAKERLEPTGLRMVFAELQKHHDALRMIYSQEQGAIVQICQEPDRPVSLQVFDLREHAQPALQLQSGVDKIQAGIDLVRGPLVKVALFQLADGDRLLIAIHHLVVDGVSWRILLEDLDTLYQQYLKQEMPALPHKTDSYKVWSEHLLSYIDSPAFAQEQAYWSALEQRMPGAIPRDYPAVDVLVADTTTLTFQLHEDETADFLTRVNDAFHTDFNDIFLTALLLAVHAIYGLDTVSVALEGHGREPFAEDIDVTRTVGWFTSIFPVILHLSHPQDLARQLKEIKENLHRIPHKGVGYGILHYLTAMLNKAEPSFLHHPQISFNYLGQFDADVEDLLSFELAPESVGSQVSPRQTLAHDWNFNCWIKDKKLEVHFEFSEKQYRQKTIESLLARFQHELRRVIALCLQSEQELTPSDFLYKDLSLDDLDALFE